MKRIHINLTVKDLEASTRFYSTLFAAEPSVRKPDYAKWMLEDPRVNFAISTHGSQHGIAHLGIQAEDEVELAEVWERLQGAAAATFDEGETTCCYARSTKRWTEDPQGVAWETFLTIGESPVYASVNGAPGVAANHPGCCS